MIHTHLIRTMTRIIQCIINLLDHLSLIYKTTLQSDQYKIFEKTDISAYIHRSILLLFVVFTYLVLTKMLVEKLRSAQLTVVEVCFTHLFFTF